nr:hypothetical protein Iba_chr07cCG11320 [Ipomoea batatas]
MHSESVAGSPLSMDSDMEQDTFEEHVAETPSLDMPVEDPPESDVHLEEGSEPPPGATIALEQTPHVEPPLVNPGIAQPRSYRDSVVGRGIDAAPFLVDNVADAVEASITEEDGFDDTPTRPKHKTRFHEDQDCTATADSATAVHDCRLRHRRPRLPTPPPPFATADSATAVRDCRLRHHRPRLPTHQASTNT